MYVGLYFITTSVIKWIDLFTRKAFGQMIIDSLVFCQENKGVTIHAWCLMPSHLHLIGSFSDERQLEAFMRDFKKFTSKKIVSAFSEVAESRSWLLAEFEFAGSRRGGYKVWQDGYHAIDLFSDKFVRQKLDYLHDNPVRAGIVFEPHSYVMSSAIDYAGGKGLLPVELISLFG
ncbi:transposase [Pedobacter sp. SYP-B3415]|uniref:REP-associated tyrosine transposase n=1 Tax=Pedobacter sp. SYP-B3415 TaxID=2496641 RepID=UPI00101BB1DF|nr:transposase [Pedobacter sp. SYP-B3415]